jgi:hypothetical protein
MQKCHLPELKSSQWKGLIGKQLNISGFNWKTAEYSNQADLDLE